MGASKTAAVHEMGMITVLCRLHLPICFIITFCFLSNCFVSESLFIRSLPSTFFCHFGAMSCGSSAKFFFVPVQKSRKNK